MRIVLATIAHSCVCPARTNAARRKEQLVDQATGGKGLAANQDRAAKVVHERRVLSQRHVGARTESAKRIAEAAL